MERFSKAIVEPMQAVYKSSERLAFRTFGVDYAQVPYATSMTLGDRHLSDPPGAIYSSPFCLSPSYGDPTSLDAFHTDTAPKPSSSPFSMHEQPQHTNRQTSLQSQPQLHTTSHGARRAHTVHGGTAHEASEMLRLIEPSGSPYEQLFSFTDEVSYHQAQSRRSPTDHLTMRGTSPVDLMVPRGTSPVDRFGTSTGMSVGVTATQAPYHHQQRGFPAGGPQRTSSETSGLDTPLDMAFLDIPGGSPTHHTPPWTPRSSNAFNECDDPLMQPLPQLDMPPTHFQDLAFSQYADTAPQHVLHPQSQPQPLQQPPQHAAPPPFRVASPARGLPFRAATSLPRATSNAGSMSLSGVCGDDSALQRRTHSPALSDAGMPASGFGCGGDGGPASRINSGATAEQRPLSHIRSMPARVRVEEAATINDFHVQDTFGGTFAIHPADPPRAEVSGMSREKSLRLLHSSITGQPNESSAPQNCIPPDPRSPQMSALTACNLHSWHRWSPARHVCIRPAPCTGEWSPAVTYGLSLLNRIISAVSFQLLLLSCLLRAVSVQLSLLSCLTMLMSCRWPWHIPSRQPELLLAEGGAAAT